MLTRTSTPDRVLWAAGIAGVVLAVRVGPLISAEGHIAVLFVPLFLVAFGHLTPRQTEECGPWCAKILLLFFIVTLAEAISPVARRMSPEERIEIGCDTINSIVDSAPEPEVLAVGTWADLFCGVDVVRSLEMRAKLHRLLAPPT